MQGGGGGPGAGGEREGEEGGGVAVESKGDDMLCDDDMQIDNSPTEPQLLIQQEPPEHESLEEGKREREEDVEERLKESKREEKKMEEELEEGEGKGNVVQAVEDSTSPAPSEETRREELQQSETGPLESSPANVEHASPKDLEPEETKSAMEPVAVVEPETVKPGAGETADIMEPKHQDAAASVELEPAGADPGSVASIDDMELVDAKQADVEPGHVEQSGVDNATEPDCEPPADMEQHRDQSLVDTADSAKMEA